MVDPNQHMAGDLLPRGVSVHGRPGLVSRGRHVGETRVGSPSRMGSGVAVGDGNGGVAEEQRGVKEGTARLGRSAVALKSVAGGENIGPGGLGGRWVG